MNEIVTRLPSGEMPNDSTTAIVGFLQHAPRRRSVLARPERLLVETLLPFGVRADEHDRAAVGAPPAATGGRLWRIKRPAGGNGIGGIDRPAVGLAHDVHVTAADHGRVVEHVLAIGRHFGMSVEPRHDPRRLRSVQADLPDALASGSAPRRRRPSSSSRRRGILGVDPVPA